MVSRVLPPALPPGHGIELFPVLHAGSSSPCGVALEPLELNVSGAFLVCVARYVAQLQYASKQHTSRTFEGKAIKPEASTIFGSNVEKPA